MYHYVSLPEGTRGGSADTTRFFLGGCSLATAILLRNGIDHRSLAVAAFDEWRATAVGERNLQYYYWIILLQFYHIHSNWMADHLDNDDILRTRSS